MNKPQLPGKLVRVTSLSFFDMPDERVWEAVKAAGRMGSDLIALPETWAGEGAVDSLDSPRITRLRGLAEEYGVYIVSGMYRKSEAHERINSAVLIGRGGKIEGIYDKVYPYWSEFDTAPVTEIGREPAVFDTDFGKIGIAICFDVNFPRVWQKMADLGARMVVWPSAYSAGASLQAHALNHNYYIITSTLDWDCAVFDITGREVLYNKSMDRENILISSAILDFDRCIFHNNFNEKASRLLAEHPHEIIQETYLYRESWFVLKSVNENISARALAGEYGLEELPAYKKRSREEIDRMRETGRARDVK